MKRVTITIVQLKNGRWRGRVRVNGEFYAEHEGPDYFGTAKQTAHYAFGVTSEMEAAE